MSNLLMYFIKVNIAIALFYLFYRLFFAGDTFWKTRRYYLLFSVLLSFVYPFFSIENWLQKQIPVQKLLVNYATLPEVTITPMLESSIFTVENILIAAYGMVVLFFLIRLLIQLSSILIIRTKGRFKTVQGTRIIAVEKEITPFSFFGSIYICPELHNEMEMKQILTHELTHVRQGHSYDVLLSEIICIIFWFNPATWLLKREIRQNLEFLADNRVIESGFDSKIYQYHLLQLTSQIPELKLTNKFNISPLKKRIIMMNQRKTSKVGMLKYLLIAPLALALVVSSNAEKLVNSAKNAIEQVSSPDPNSKKIKKTIQFSAPSTKKITTPPPSQIKDGELVPTTLSSNDIIFQVVDKMPVFPGGESELMSYIAQNVRYPVEAQKNGIQGRVICSFVIKADGTIADTKTIRSIDPYLDAEALRVIKAMPKWTPGEQKGEKVSVQYTLPISFKLEGEPKTNPWGDKPIVILDGQMMAPNFNPDIIKPESIEKIEVQKPNTEESKKELISRHGKWAGNGVVKITIKK
ncbi:MAG: TonB family protein [Paludibacter sp.]